MKALFKLDGHNGVITDDDFIIWHTVRCHLSALGECELKKVALEALEALDRFTVVADYIDTGVCIYRVHDTQFDVFVNRRNEIDDIGYITKVEAEAVAEYLNSIAV